MMVPMLPAGLADHTGPILTAERPTQGGFYDVTILTGERGRFVLKAGRTEGIIAELHAECRVLTALQDRAPFVPVPVAHVVAGGEGLFLFTCVEGRAITDVADTAGPSDLHALMHALGRALRELHTWTPPLPRPADWLDEATTQAEANLAAGRIPAPLTSRYRCGGQNPREVLDSLKAWPPVPDLVFSHGDCCLPNVLVQGGQVTGFIDWSRGGYADRRMDLAAAAWSIRHNLKDEAYVDTFLEAYGYQGDLDWFEALWTLI